MYVGAAVGFSELMGGITESPTASLLTQYVDGDYARALGLFFGTPLFGCGSQKPSNQGLLPFMPVPVTCTKCYPSRLYLLPVLSGTLHACTCYLY